MGETDKFHVFYFGIFGRVPDSPSHLLLSLETKGHWKTKSKPWNVFETIICMNLKVPEISRFENGRKDGCRNIPPIRFKNMENHGYEGMRVWSPWNLENNKPKASNHKASKPNNPKSKEPINQETKKPKTKKLRNQEPPRHTGPLALNEINWAYHEQKGAISQITKSKSLGL